MPLDPAALQDISLLAFLLVFVGGVVTSIGPCNIATIPLIVGYVGGSRDLRAPAPSCSRWPLPQGLR
jgi:cytochrome c biogenesis protein CcdA